jgi:hypothetical protein
MSDPRIAPEVVARLRALAERSLSAEEIEAALAVPDSAEERAEKRALIRWFRQRYPTPAARLAYARRAAARMWRP